MYELHPQVAALNAQPQMVQRSEEWFLARKTRITASEISSVMDVNPYKSKRAMWREKVAVLRGDPDKDKKKSFSTEWGVKYEPVVQTIVRKRFPYTQETLFEYGMVCHPTIPYIGASPDGILFNGCMIEIKCTTTRELKEFEVVPYYYAQLQTQMECCQLEEVEFIESKFVEYRNMTDFLIDVYTPEHQRIARDAAGSIGARTWYLRTCEGKRKGLIAERQGVYEYYGDTVSDDVCDDLDAIREWVRARADARVTFWKCEVMLCKRVKKNPEYVANMLRVAGEFWASVVDASAGPREDDDRVFETRCGENNSHLFENFVHGDVIVMYEKKQDLWDPEEATPKKSACMFRIPSK